MNRLMGLSRCRTGAAALEFALVAPLFLAIIGGSVELARWGWGAAALRDAVAQAARCVQVAPQRCNSLQAVRADIARQAPIQTLAATRSPCGIRLTATGGFPAVLTPGLGRTSASACAG